METTNLNVIELEIREMQIFEGGTVPPSWGPWGVAILVGIAVVEGCYSAGEAVGKALYHAIN